MISQRYKLYVLAFVIYTATAVVTATLQALATRYEEIAVLAPIITTLSGNFLGGFALVIGILRDDRAEKERQRAEKERQRAEKAEETAQKAQKQIGELRQAMQQAQQQAKQERDRADRAEAELQRVRAEREREIEERVRRLEISAGFAPPESADDDSEDEATAE